MEKVNYAVVCTETELIVNVSLQQLPGDIVEAIEGWLEAHGIGVNQVVQHHPIRRSPETHEVSWYGWDSQPRKHLKPYVITLSGPSEPDVVWPAPFPDVLLQQPSRDRPRAEVVRTAAGWHLRVVAANGEPLVSSEVYESREAVVNCLDLLRLAALPASEVDER